MKRAGDSFVTVCSLVLVAAIILLVPGRGLVTLTIPDNEPGTVTSASANFPHTGKRNVDDPFRTLLGAVPSGSALPKMLIASSTIRPDLSPQVRSATVIHLDARGPPVSAVFS